MELKFNNIDVEKILYNSKEVDVCRFNTKLIFAPEGFIDINEYIDVCSLIEKLLIENSVETTELKKIYDAAIKLSDMGRVVNESYNNSNFSAIYGQSFNIDINNTDIFPIEVISDEYKLLFNSCSAGITILLLNNDILDVSHFWAAIEAYLRKNCIVDTNGVNTTTYPNCGSWLGDSITVAADIKNGLSGNKVEFLNENSKFPKSDWISNMDAANIYSLFINKNIKLTDVMKSYFSMYLTEKERVNSFINTFGDFNVLYSQSILTESVALLAAEYKYGLISMTDAALGKADTVYVPLVIELINEYVEIYK